MGVSITSGLTETHHLVGGKNYTSVGASVRMWLQTAACNIFQRLLPEKCSHAAAARWIAVAVGCCSACPLLHDRSFDKGLRTYNFAQNSLHRCLLNYYKWRVPFLSAIRPCCKCCKVLVRRASLSAHVRLALTLSYSSSLEMFGRFYMTHHSMRKPAVIGITSSLLLAAFI